MRAFLRIALAATALLLSLSAGLAAPITVTGDVTYRERVALPPGGSLTVSLIDLARPETPRVEASGAIASPGQVPLTFSLHFDDSIIIAGHSYALVAEIAGEDGGVWFRNAEPYPVDPVNPAQPLLIVVNLAASPAEPGAQAVAEAPPPILDITWQADAIAGKPVADGVASTLAIAGDMRAGGNGGCNSWFAQAELGPDTLAFSAVAATRMACASTLKTVQEEAFFAALAATRGWRLRDESLVLLDASGAELASFSKSRF